MTGPNNVDKVVTVGRVNWKGPHKPQTGMSKAFPMLPMKKAETRGWKNSSREQLLVLKKTEVSTTLVEARDCQHLYQSGHNCL